MILTARVVSQRRVDLFLPAKINMEYKHFPLSNAVSVHFVLMWKVYAYRTLNSDSLPGGALSPDKSKYLGITEYNEVEAYDLHLQRFIAKITHSSGPYRSILMVVYIDRDSAALVHKLPQGDEHHVEIIPRLEIGRANASFCLQIGQTEPDTPRALRVLHPVIVSTLGFISMLMC